ncbi:glutamate racemase [Neolewinella persica]|uniref:glutamate racemase n=1 Tax=Neolewinella persica TaxID=70998 RepID=UPI00035E5E94|nr:glutamate racemase [Neolewinella persica]
MQPLQPATIAPIGVFDSGIGGLSVADAVCRLLPAESLLYVADNAYAPYGPRPADEILERSKKITQALIGAGAKMIVVACNTATSIAIDALRQDFPKMPFVGLEPAVKPAASGRKVGVLATYATLNSPRYLALKARYLADRPVFEDPCIGLVSLIESEAPGSEQLRDKLHAILNPMLMQGLDTLVLGCTHYPMVKEDIAAVCGPSVTIIDPAPAAARQVERLLPEARPAAGYSPTLLLNPVPGTSGLAHNFYSTGSSLPTQRALLRLPLLNRDRRLVVPGVRI